MQSFARCCCRQRLEMELNVGSFHLGDSLHKGRHLTRRHRQGSAWEHDVFDTEEDFPPPAVDCFMSFFLSAFSSNPFPFCFMNFPNIFPIFFRIIVKPPINSLTSVTVTPALFAISARNRSYFSSVSLLPVYQNNKKSLSCLFS